jgi:hypothetical protein
VPSPVVLKESYLALGLSDSGAALSEDFFAAGRRAADAGAELVGRGSGAGAAACAGDVAAAACGGSAFMMLTGGIDWADGNVTFGPGGVTGPEPGALEASGRVRVGQLTA